MWYPCPPDKEGCTHVDDYTVNTPTGFKEAYDLYTESGWQGLSFPPAYGGQGLPMSVALFQVTRTAFLHSTQPYPTPRPPMPKSTSTHIHTLI